MPGKKKPSANTKKGKGRVKGGSVFDGTPEDQVEQMEVDSDNESVAVAAAAAEKEKKMKEKKDKKGAKAAKPPKAAKPTAPVVPVGEEAVDEVVDEAVVEADCEASGDEGSGGEDLVADDAEVEDAGAGGDDEDQIEVSDDGMPLIVPAKKKRRKAITDQLSQEQEDDLCKWYRENTLFYDKLKRVYLNAETRPES